MIPISSHAIDVVIPLVEKDLDVASYCVQSIRSLVGHKIGTIFIVAPESQKIKDFAKLYDCEFINEDLLLTSKRIKKQGGWIIQQFLKLNADSITKNDHFLVVDADTIFLRPVVFMDGSTYLINIVRDCCLKRKRTTSQFLGNNRVYQYDFVAHHMLFSKKILRQMKEYLEKKYNKSWDKFFIDELERAPSHRSGFSEYELYATYLTEFSGADFRFVSGANIGVYRDFLDRVDQIIPAYANQYKTINLHSPSVSGFKKRTPRKPYHVGIF